MIRLAIASAAALLLVPAVAAAQDHTGHSVHAGKETRAIKALSADEVKALLAGEGAGYALAAELNRYPGPRHVLDLQQALALTPEQVRDVTRIFEAMNARARELGARVVHQESELDAAFAQRSVTRETLKSLLDRTAALEAELRFVHLEAHLQTTALLSAEQIQRYDRERGYASSPAHR